MDAGWNGCSDASSDARGTNWNPCNEAKCDISIEVSGGRELCVTVALGNDNFTGSGPLHARWHHQEVLVERNVGG